MDRTYTVVVCCSWVLLPAAVAATAYAAAQAGVVGAVYAGGPLTVLAGLAVIAYRARRELRGSYVRDLAEANAREDRIADT